jgi:peroxiredoxin
MRFLFLLLSALSLFPGSSPAQGPQPGGPAPGFSLRGASRDSISSRPFALADHRGRDKVILAFYPADWSSGCTKEMCTLRDNFSALAELGAVVYGVSGDYVYSHHAWAKDLGLPFVLLSDHDHRVAAAYDSYDPARGMNRRSLYLVDTSGAVAYVDPAYKVSDPAAFERLRGAVAAAR